MERQAGGQWQPEIRDIALELLKQGERCTLIGLLEQAEALLSQAWKIAANQDSALANRAAWGIAWLLMQMEEYGQAMEWFRRVETPPDNSDQLWPIARQALARICQIAIAHAPAPEMPLRESVVASASLPARLLPLKVINFGRFQVIRGGISIPTCKSRKPIAIFRYLLTRRRYSAYKEELMELFWPEAAPPEAAHSLHVAVSTLRRHLDPIGASYLLFEGDCYTINPDASLTDDCHMFQSLIDEAERYWRVGDLERALNAYTEAIAYYQGDYYVDVQDLSWATAERERLLVRYLMALDHMGQILIKQGLFEAAIDCFQHLLERDIYREDAHCQLMRCYWQLGQRGMALRQYERCANVLETDLGLEPGDDLKALYQVLSGRCEVSRGSTLAADPTAPG
jgi:DNA-binding SARP family transcriptional activator